MRNTPVCNKAGVGSKLTSDKSCYWEEIHHFFFRFRAWLVTSNSDVSSVVYFCGETIYPQKHVETWMLMSQPHAHTVLSCTLWLLTQSCRHCCCVLLIVYFPICLVLEEEICIVFILYQYSPTNWQYFVRCDKLVKIQERRRTASFSVKNFYGNWILPIFSVGCALFEVSPTASSHHANTFRCKLP